MSQTYMQADVNETKLGIIEQLMKLNDPEKLEFLENVVFELTRPPGKQPCQYTVEEMEERLRQSEEDIKAGRVYSMEEVMKEWGTW